MADKGQTVRLSTPWSFNKLFYLTETVTCIFYVSEWQTVLYMQHNMSDSFILH